MNEPLTREQAVAQAILIGFVSSDAETMVALIDGRVAAAAAAKHPSGPTKTPDCPPVRLCAPVGTSVVWAKPKRDQWFWDAKNAEWTEAGVDHFGTIRLVALERWAVVCGYPASVGGHRWVEVLPEAPAKPAPTADDYLRGHKASGFKVGDRVRVTGTAKSSQRGWRSYWVPYMDVYVGQTLEVTADAKGMGFVLNEGDCFPYFVLERVAVADPAPAPGQVWGDAQRRMLVLSAGPGVVLADSDTWVRGGWMSVVEAGRVLRGYGYRYLGEAEIGIKEKD